MDSNNPRLALLVYLVWVVLSSVLLLNLLIAMMGKTFQRDNEDTDRIWTFPFAALVLKYEKLRSNDQVRAYLIQIMHHGFPFCHAWRRSLVYFW
jgi:hypothetical protein